MQVKIQIHQQIQVNALTHVLTQFSEKVDFEPNIVVKYAIKKTVIYKFHQMFGTKKWSTQFIIREMSVLEILCWLNTKVPCTLYNGAL